MVMRFAPLKVVHLYHSSALLLVVSFIVFGFYTYWNNIVQ
uniref:TLC domain-containing protein n=1 Tax=Heterorhabditis bacteriophora TaxID=37862 RepID=A0A1I7X9H4_HETBA